MELERAHPAFASHVKQFEQGEVYLINFEVHVLRAFLGCRGELRLALAWVALVR